MKSAAIAVLQAYKRWLSPMLPNACRYVPTCSEYAMEAVEQHGTMRGMVMGLWRFLRCNPLGGHGYDPVPPATIGKEDLALRRCCHISK